MAEKKATTKKKSAPKAVVEEIVPKKKDYKKVLEGILIKLKKDPMTRREMINMIQSELK